MAETPSGEEYSKFIFGAMPIIKDTVCDVIIPASFSFPKKTPQTSKPNPVRVKPVARMILLFVF